MKKYIISLLAFTLLGTGCADYLDKMPDDMKTDDMVWRSRDEVEK